MIKLFIILISTSCYGQMPLQNTNQVIKEYQAVWEMPLYDNVGMFYLYIGTNKIDCSTNTYYRFWWTNQLPICSITSYDTNGNESYCVYETNITSVQMIPLTLNHPCAIGSTNLHDWYPITNVLVPNNKPQEYFRVIQ